MDVISIILTPISKDVLIPLSPYPLRHSKCKPLGLGYAFFETFADARNAVDSLHTMEFKSRNLTVRYHTPYNPVERTGSFRLGKSRENKHDGVEQPLLIPNEALSTEEAQPERKPSVGSSVQVKIFNGLRAKADAAKTVTSTILDTKNVKEVKVPEAEAEAEANDAQELEVVEAPKSATPAVPTRPIGNSSSLRRLSTYHAGKDRRAKGDTTSDAEQGSARASMLDPEDNTYSDDTIFIRGLKGKVTKDLMFDYFKAYNPVKVKITKTHRLAKAWNPRSNVLVRFKFKNGINIDKVVEECQSCLFDGNPFEVSKAFIRKAAMTPSPALGDSSPAPEANKEVTEEEPAASNASLAKATEAPSKATNEENGKEAADGAPSAEAKVEVKQPKLEEPKPSEAEEVEPKVVEEAKPEAEAKPVEVEVKT